MSEKFSVEIISPENLIIKTNTREVIIPSYEGEMGILKDHIHLITFLRPGIIKIVSDDKDRNFFVEEGTVEFSNNNLLILTSSVREVSDLSDSMLESLLSEAEKRINSDEISDKEKYLLSYKISTLKNISQ